MRMIMAVLVVFLVAGCATATLVKEGVTPEQFAADKFECEQKVVTMQGGYARMDLGDHLIVRQNLLRCLHAKGYREATDQERANLNAAAQAH